jgi:hypothetical protein
MSGGATVGPSSSFLEIAQRLGAVRTFEKPIRLDKFLGLVADVLRSSGVR